MISKQASSIFFLWFLCLILSESSQMLMARFYHDLVHWVNSPRSFWFSSKTLSGSHLQEMACSEIQFSMHSNGFPSILGSCEVPACLIVIQQCLILNLLHTIFCNVSTQCPAKLGIDRKRYCIQNHALVCAYAVGVHILQLWAYLINKTINCCFALEELIFFKVIHLCVISGWTSPNKLMHFSQSRKRTQVSTLGKLLICVWILCGSANISILCQKRVSTAAL